MDAGRYDGNLGVVLGIVVAEALREQESHPSCPIEIVAFGDEENVRFPTNLSTSYALAGRLRPGLARRKGCGGHHVTRSAHRLRRRSDRGIAALTRDPARYRGYLEVHIEQGPQLEAGDLPVGIVSAINGITRPAPP